jgi:hypothetical protein
MRPGGAGRLASRDLEGACRLASFSKLIRHLRVRQSDSAVAPVFALLADLSALPYPGTYRYYVQVEDEAGRWSHARSAAIVINQRVRHVAQACP